MARRCANCASKVEDGVEACPSCGTALPQGGSSGVKPLRPSLPEVEAAPELEPPPEPTPAPNPPTSPGRPTVEARPAARARTRFATPEADEPEPTRPLGSPRSAFARAETAPEPDGESTAAGIAPPTHDGTNPGLATSPGEEPPDEPTAAVRKVPARGNSNSGRPRKRRSVLHDAPDDAPPRRAAREDSTERDFEGVDDEGGEKKKGQLVQANKYAHLMSAEERERMNRPLDDGSRPDPADPQPGDVDGDPMVLIRQWSAGLLGLPLEEKLEVGGGAAFLLMSFMPWRATPVDAELGLGSLYGFLGASAVSAALAACWFRRNGGGPQLAPELSTRIELGLVLSAGAGAIASFFNAFERAGPARAGAKASAGWLAAWPSFGVVLAIGCVAVAGAGAALARQRELGRRRG